VKHQHRSERAADGRARGGREHNRFGCVGGMERHRHQGRALEKQAPEVRNEAEPGHRPRRVAGSPPRSGPGVDPKQLRRLKRGRAGVHGAPGARRSRSTFRLPSCVSPSWIWFQLGTGGATPDPLRYRALSGATRVSKRRFSVTLTSGQAGHIVAASEAKSRQQTRPP